MPIRAVLVGALHDKINGGGGRIVSRVLEAGQNNGASEQNS